jgi:translation elongation factor EF-Ts
MISANAVKELREKTGVGMMECKKPLLKQMVILIKLLIS